MHCRPVLLRDMNQNPPSPHAPPRSIQRLAPAAYQALRDALPIIFWHKRPFERFLRVALRDHPELLNGLVFSDLKRNVSDDLIDRLVEREDACRDTTIGLMAEIASMDRFPDLEATEDASIRIPQAQAAVAEMRRWTQHYMGALEERDRLEQESRTARSRQAALRRFSDELRKLDERFLSMHGSDKPPQERGREFQGFLSEVFELFDMEPRFEYSLTHEQLDGSFTFDTDDYIVEARWRKEAASRADFDVFAAKVRRKGKNALGLFVSVNGFTSDALETYREQTPFVTMDGTDLMSVLQAFVRLDDLFRAKKRHANETGDCYFPAQRL